ncbi:MAG TPA: HypC/HybG/HupF family hydrogenase formation chaperone [Candidatus Gallacutalibacter pullicola]|uniref:HypC/HybG/HupF family hydrogenase formation chaperone n=1 Tax=Candidatus Gallacutalibacter pullicola TaxID=2840830 RepID=A0A9D1DP18_9FIRM|nr:HypC/HybG/HupF family hydrogenase formation chaperone [Candidatus Gallacutalibacter pullicola]
MCLAIPMKITKIDGLTATGEAGGLLQDIRIDFLEDVKSGDYVMVHAGFAIQKMTEQEALENLELLEEIRDAL